MDLATSIATFLSAQDIVVKLVLLIFLIIYNFYAVALAFQIFSYNRLFTQRPFAPVFKSVALIHSFTSAILLIIVILSL